LCTKPQHVVGTLTFGSKYIAARTAGEMIWGVVGLLVIFMICFPDQESAAGVSDTNQLLDQYLASNIQLSLADIKSLNAMQATQGGELDILCCTNGGSNGGNDDVIGIANGVADQIGTSVDPAAVSGGHGSRRVHKRYSGARCAIARCCCPSVHNEHQHEWSQRYHQ
jgi:hypothetical protein